MERFDLGRGARLIVQQGDITKASVDAIVNAANEPMLGGGGVDGAIHVAAGTRLLAACQEVEEVRPGVRCPTGEARLTLGFNLPSRHVIHTVGPVYRSREESAPLLASAYRSSLALANQEDLRSIAFPAISCGVYGYPLAEAAEVGVKVMKDHVGGLTELRWFLFGVDAYNAYVEVVREMLLGGSNASRLST